MPLQIRKSGDYIYDIIQKAAVMQKFKECMKMKKISKIVLAVLAFSAVALGAAAAIAAYKTKFHKKYITVCE